VSQPARRGDRPVLDQGDARALISALGGFRGLTDSGLPGVVFGFSYLFWGLGPALRAALAVGALLLVVRLVRRQTVQYAATGFLLLGVAALLARQTGNAADFYLPGFFTTGGLAVVFAVSALARYPAVGLVLGPLLGEDLAWRLAQLPARSQRRRGRGRGKGSTQGGEPPSSACPRRMESGPVRAHPCVARRLIRGSRCAVAATPWGRSAPSSRAWRCSRSSPRIAASMAAAE